MSRRDEALTAVDGLLTTVRTQIAAALDDGTHDGSHHPPSLVDRLRLAVQPSTPSSQPETAINHDGDALPSYSRADDTADDDNDDSSLPPRRARRLESKTGKLVLDLYERFGPADRLVVLQHLPDTSPTLIRGTLTLRLRDPETITHVRIRLKGIVRTLVFKAHASGRHPVSDEVCFLEDSHPLWYRTDPQDGSVHYPPPPGENATSPEEAAAGKLQGTFRFPFVLTIPARLTHLPHTGQPYQPRPIRPPPSFMLDGNTTSSASSSSSSGAKSSPPAAALGGFEGSCRYYLKVTLGRAGLLKLNERWIVPVVFVPRQPVPVSPSPLRELALASTPATKTPNSKQDPQGWTDPGKYVTRTAMKKSSRFSRSAGAAAAAGWVRLEGRVPKPQKFSKANGELLEFEVQITCADATSLARFTPATIAVSLLQRTIVSAQGISNTYDSIVLHANRVTAIGGPAGYPVRGVGGAVAHEIVYSGAIKLVPALTTSFRAPNLQVAYLLCITLYQPTVPKSNGVVIPPSIHLSSLAIPVEIVSTPPRVRAAQQSSSSWSLSPPANGDPPLPPPPPPMYPAPSEPPPPPPPSRMTTTTTTTTSAAATGEASTPAAGGATIDQAEESRLEELYGLPPSYFEVVENERSSSPAASGGGTSGGGGGGFFGRRGAR
ncbi:hypothetical protein B0A53_05008 [Rhodotorula sp. CCFEE 5036]|nr:hypothetical protein B0A53_05008 [Rhodotorula sp. CCFEE 5036]